MTVSRFKGGVLRYSQLAQRILSVKGWNALTALEDAARAVVPLWSDLAGENRYPKGEMAFSATVQVVGTGGQRLDFSNPATSGVIDVITNIEVQGFVIAAAIADVYQTWIQRTNSGTQPFGVNALDQRWAKPVSLQNGRGVGTFNSASIGATALPVTPNLSILSQASFALPATLNAIVQYFANLIPASPEQAIVLPPGTGLQIFAAPSAAVVTGGRNTITCWGYERAVDAAELV